MACPCPYPPEILVKDAELRELGHLLTSNLTHDHDPVIFNMGGDGPVRGRVRWQTRRARRAQCATALALAILAVLVAVGTLVADGESAPTDAGACSGARAGEPATIYNMVSSWVTRSTTRRADNNIGAVEDGTTGTAAAPGGVGADDKNKVNDNGPHQGVMRREPQCASDDDLGGLHSRTRWASPSQQPRNKNPFCAKTVKNLFWAH